MTFSLVATDEHRTEWGVVVASKYLAVGVAVPAAAVDVGAVATQAWANALYAVDGLRLLEQGLPAADCRDRLLALDPDPHVRQLGVVDAAGRSATWTGGRCSPWAGGRCGPGWAAQGNLLSGPEVLDAMTSAFETTSGPLAGRLLAAVRAGDDAGGDRRGRQSAALLVVGRPGAYGYGSTTVCDLRVDDSPAPVEELSRLLALHERDVAAESARPVPLTGEVGAEVEAGLRLLGYDDLAAWAEARNYLHRLDRAGLPHELLSVLREEVDQARTRPATGGPVGERTQWPPQGA